MQQFLPPQIPPFRDDMIVVGRVMPVLERDLGAWGLCGVARWYTEAVAPVAQLDRAFGYEPKGRVFESRRAHQLVFSFNRLIAICFVK